jgi:hypothetical protein
VDPVAGAAYYDFSSRPLFVNGPQYNDIRQGQVADCYFVASLASLADSDPQVIRQMIAPLGDGTYVARFYQSGAEVYVRVDAQVPASGSSTPYYAKLTPDGELWVALTEKAYAQFRRGQNSYASLSYGNMAEVYYAVTNNAGTGCSPSALSKDALAQYILGNLQAGHAMTAGSSSSPTGPIVGGHAYMVKSVQSVGGQWYVTVFNPWGFDGTSVNDGNSQDGLVTISMDLFRQDFVLLSVCMV